MSDPSDDFNPKKAYEALSAHIEQPDKFAELFCKAAKKQKAIDDVLKELIKHMLSQDKETMEHVKKLQREVDSEDWKSFLKKMGAASWAVIWTIVGAALTTLVGVLIKKYW